MRQRDILLFWFPLFASWLLMTAEGPTISAAINRLPNEVIMLAAMGIVTSLSVTIESPIINLLATSTALVRDYDSYRQVRRFTLHWCFLLTVVAAAMAFTSLFDFVVLDLLDVPAEVAAWVRPGMQIMVFWSAAIGWRRFLQGILIRFNETRKIAWGTVIRLAASAGTVIALALWGEWSGVIIGALALMAGVLAEAAYSTIIVQPILQNQLAPDKPPYSETPLTYGELTRFHLPLAATSLLILLVQPLVTSSLARLDQPTLSLAAWPVLFQILLMGRAAALALPEVIIALYEDDADFHALRRFSYGLAAIVLLLMGLFIFSPLASGYLFRVQDLTPGVASLVLSSLALFIAYPTFAVLISWVRGLLIQGRATRHVNIGMAINLTITVVVLVIALAQQRPGLPSAAVALNLAVIAEFIYLAWQAQTRLPLNLTLFGWRVAVSTPSA